MKTEDEKELIAKEREEKKRRQDEYYKEWLREHYPNGREKYKNK